MTVNLTIQNICQANDIPSHDTMTQWANSALQTEQEVELCVRIVDQEEIQQLNADYRGKNQPTNILSFPFDMHNVDLDVPILGDLVICADIIHSESKAQHKSRSAHWAHMIIHGVLHLQGFDHETDEQAEQMEKKEIELLAKFGYDNPYEEHND